MFIKRKLLSRISFYIEKPEVLIITGFRRVGKSTLIKYIFDNLKTNNKIFLDLESPVNQRIFKKENYEAIISELKNLGLRINRERAYVFLDEVQYLKNIPSVVKYLFDHYQIKFIMTGSSSFYLKNLFTESLAGRKFLFELYPLDFEEFLWFKGEKLSLASDYHFLRHFYDEYMEFGGLPGVVLENNRDDKNLRLDEVLGSYFN
ncbi:MAG: ATP-binding protein, partial [Microgenomates group bacterium]